MSGPVRPTLHQTKKFDSTSGTSSLAPVGSRLSRGKDNCFKRFCFASYLPPSKSQHLNGRHGGLHTLVTMAPTGPVPGLLQSISRN